MGDTSTETSPMHRHSAHAGTGLSPPQSGCDVGHPEEGCGGPSGRSVPNLLFGGSPRRERFPPVVPGDSIQVMVIQSYDDSHLDEVVALSLRAWEPVFRSMEEAMDPAVFEHFYPNWRVSQAEAVEAACTDDEMHLWVAEEEGRAVGFVALKLHMVDRMGEIHMIAVDPDYQRQGIARALTDHALDWFEDAGMSVVMVETGGDPGHAPARRAYEASGFRVLPVARYFKKI